jgi:hypothetical protein
MEPVPVRIAPEPNRGRAEAIPNEPQSWAKAIANEIEAEPKWPRTEPMSVQSDPKRDRGQAPAGPKEREAEPKWPRTEQKPSRNDPERVRRQAEAIPNGSNASARAYFAKVDFFNRD